MLQRCIVSGSTISFTLKYIKNRKHFSKYHSPRMLAKSFCMYMCCHFYTLYGSSLLAEGGGEDVQQPKTQGLSPYNAFSNEYEINDSNEVLQHQPPKFAMNSALV